MTETWWKILVTVLLIVCIIACIVMYIITKILSKPKYRAIREIKYYIKKYQEIPDYVVNSCIEKNKEGVINLLDENHYIRVEKTFNEINTKIESVTRITVNDVDGVKDMCLVSYKNTSFCSSIPEDEYNNYLDKIGQQITLVDTRIVWIPDTNKGDQ